MKSRYFLVFIFLFLIFRLTNAQTLSIATTLSDELLIEPEITLSNLNAADSKLNFRIANSISGPLELGFGVAYTNSFGPIGTLQLFAQADLNLDGQYRLSSQAKGVIGNVAAELELVVFDSPKHNFDTISLVSEDNFIYNSSFAVQVNAVARYRLERSLILDAALSLPFVEGSLGAKLDAALNFQRIVDRDNVAALAKVYTSPGFTTYYLALGGTYDLNNRDYPNVLASAWLGFGTKGFYPGTYLEISETLSEFDTKLGAQLRFEPYLLDAATIQAYVFYEQELPTGSLILQMGAHELESVFGGFVKLSYRYAFEN